MRSNSQGAPEVPDNATKARKDTRAVVSLVARYRSPTTFEYASEECGDVSIGGMFIKSGSPADTGTLLKLECETDLANEPLIKGVARVVWLRRETNDHGPSGMGVKFVKLEPGSRERIEALVLRLAAAGVEAESMSSIAPEQRSLSQRGKPPTPSRQPAAHGPADPADSGERTTAPDPSAGAHDRITPIKSVFETDDTTPARTDASEWAWRDRVASEPPPAANTNEDGYADSAGQRPSARPSATGSVRPTAPRKSRFGLRGWLLLGLLGVIAIVIADRRGFGPSWGATDSVPAQPKPKAPPPTAAAPSNPTRLQPSAAEEPAPTAPLAQATAEPEPAAAAASAEPSGAAEPAPAAPSAAADPATASRSVAPGEAKPGDPLPPPLIAPADGQPPYVLDFVSRPAEASVSIDEMTELITPATVNLGAMPKRVKITARKAGFRSSSIWFERSGFELKDGIQRRRVYLTLKPEFP